MDQTKRLKFYGKKIRVSLCLSASSYNILAVAKKHNGHNHSQIVDSLIQQKLGDPITTTKLELKELAKTINEKQDYLKHLEELQQENEN